jgi:phosphatidate cytidylyltransferase
LDWLIGLDLFFNLLGTIVVLLALHEFYRMCEAVGMTPFRMYGAATCVILTVCLWFSLPGTIERFGGPWWALRIRDDLVPLGLLAAVLGSFWLQATKRDNAKAFESISTTLLGVLYCWFLLSFLMRLRHIGADGRPGGPDWPGFGTRLVIACIAVSKVSDIGAFFIGRWLGRHKLITRISPNKTWEGAWAGLASSVVASIVVGQLVLPAAMDVWRLVVFGVFVGGMGQFGDLAESLLKRAGGIKDAGTLIPGFGGTLDLIDSLMISAPVAYFLSLLMLGGGP